jgi:hypothetical protein
VNLACGHITSKMKEQAIAYKDGRVGGYLVGKTHKQGGIQIVNVDSGQPIEAQDGEVIIMEEAVNSPERNDFNGETLTNKEILSRINEKAGGVSFMEEGGQLKHGACCFTSKDHRYRYNGRDLTGMEVLQEMAKGGKVDCGCQHMPEDLKVAHRFLPVHVGKGAQLPATFNETEQQVIDHFRQFPRSYVTLYGHDKKDISGLIDGNLVYATGMLNTGYMDVFLTPEGRKLLFPLRAESGAQLNTYAQPLILKRGGETETIQQYFKGVKATYKNPYEINRAIEELLDSHPTNLNLSSEEKQFLTYYTGYGGLEKFGAEGIGILYEYYTPSAIAEIMWGLAYKYGYKGGAVLEPACGIGEFFKFLPDRYTDAVGYEINPYSARIAGILYPTVFIENKSFEELFIKGRNTVKNKIEGLKKFSLVIGNPPYGNFEGKFAGLGERSYSRAKNYIDYFIFRGLDLLEPGGLLIYIVGSEVQAGGVPFLGQEKNLVKKEIWERSKLLDAYRLPNGVFERTDVLSDIIVLQKK